MKTRPPIRIAALLCAACALVFGLVLGSAHAHAADVSASAEPQTVNVGDYLNFSVSANSEGNQKIQVRARPEFGDAFQVVGTSKAPSYMIRNGKAQRSLTLTYRLRALREGKHALEPPPVHISGKEHRARPVTVKVMPGGSAKQRARQRKKRPSQRDSSLFVEHVLEPTRSPYIGEQITLSYYLYSDAFGRRVQPQPPDEPSLDEFWIEDLSQHTSGKRQTVRQGGRTMERANLRSYALFALGAGSVTIEPFSVDVVAGGMFQSGRKNRLTSDPIAIDVQPLPANAPESFYEGNVGQWNFEVRSDRTRAPMGRAITIRVSAEGTGQVGRIALPELGDVDGARITGSNEHVDRHIKAGVVGGSKTLEYTVVAEREGTLTIPALTFSYFDPDAEAYDTHTSEPIEIEVRGGQVTLESQAPPDAGSSNDNNEADLLQTLVGRLSAPTSEVGFAEPSQPLRDNALFWVLAAVAALGTLLVWLATPLGAVWKRLRPGIQRGASYREALALVDPTAPDDADSLDRVRRALSIYMTRVAGVPAGSITEADLGAHLQQRDVPDELVERIISVVRDLDQARYSPDKDARQALAEELRVECRTCIERLEAERRRRRWSARSAASIAMVGVSVAAVLIAAPQDAHAQPAADARVDQAVQAHAENKWAEAATLWQQIAEEHPGAAGVQYNLGTSLAHTGDLGGARLALERASAMSPRDAAIDNNRDIVEQLVRLRQVEEARGTIHDNTSTDAIFWWRLATAVSDDAVALGFLVALWLLFAGSLVRRLSRGERLRTTALVVLIIAAVVTLMVAGTWVARERVLDEVRPAVVTADEIALRQGPSAHAGLADIRATVVAGVLLPVVDSRPGWVELGFADGTTAWTRRDNVGTVRRPYLR